MVRPIGFEPMQWVRALAADEPLPNAKQLTTAAISGPGHPADPDGRDPRGDAARASICRHAAGRRWPDTRRASWPCESLEAKGAKDVELLALLQLIGAAGTLVSRRRGMVGARRQVRRWCR